MFNEEKRTCANEDCLMPFVAKVYNTIYCSAECRKIVTNKKLLEKYHERKINKTKKRICKNKDCNTVLSSYNREDICESCKQKRFKKRLISWGWDEKKLNNEI